MWKRYAGWWYVAIGLGFCLLGINRLVIHDRSPLVALRFLIAAGFITLGYFEIRKDKRQP